MNCPYCGRGTGVEDSRPAGDGSIVRRKRRCKACRKTLRTVELPQVRLKVIRVQEGVPTKERFDELRLSRSIFRCFQDQKNAISFRDYVLSRTLRQLLMQSENEVSAAAIYELVYEQMHELHPQLAERYQALRPLSGEAELPAVTPLKDEQLDLFK
ncbi:MAG: hypothetical protein ACR2PW_00950 [Gammaproteobacteria bacterium]